MTNRYRNPLNWALEQIDTLKVEIEGLKQEIKRLDREKAGRKGRKPKN
jgi:ubiquinone biosynthesis protein UbiJ